MTYVFPAVFNWRDDGCLSDQLELSRIRLIAAWSPDLEAHPGVTPEECGIGKEDSLRQNHVLQQESGSGDVHSRAAALDRVPNARDVICGDEAESNINITGWVRIVSLCSFSNVS